MKAASNAFSELQYKTQDAINGGIYDNILVAAPKTVQNTGRY